jgi:hypothetical protein
LARFPADDPIASTAPSSERDAEMKIMLPTDKMEFAENPIVFCCELALQTPPDLQG